MKVGLTLSGGGALGAYEAGAIRAIAELGIKVEGISGASIGALNGAVLATAPTLEEGAKRLEEIWILLAEETIFCPDGWGLFSLLSMLGLRSPWWDGNIFQSRPLENLLQKYISIDSFDSGLPFYVSVTKIQNLCKVGLELGATLLGMVDISGTTYLHIQKLPKEERINALLASAAIPLVFAPQSVGHEKYVDGGVGGWLKDLGNTPVIPLYEAGFNPIIVLFLNSASLWSRHEFKDASIVEIRPSHSDNMNPSLLDLLNFDLEKIKMNLKRGYEDTKNTFIKIKNSLQIEMDRRESLKKLNEDLSVASSSFLEKRAAIRNLKNLISDFQN